MAGGLITEAIEICESATAPIRAEGGRSLVGGAAGCGRPLEISRRPIADGDAEVSSTDSSLVSIGAAIGRRRSGATAGEGRTHVLMAFIRLAVLPVTSVAASLV